MVLDYIICDQRVLAIFFHFVFVVISKFLDENFIAHHLHRFEYSYGFQKVKEPAVSEFEHVGVWDKRYEVINELAIQIVERNFLKTPHW